MSGILFSESVPNVLQKDHMKPIFSSKGFDSLESIGIPLVYIIIFYFYLIKIKY